MLTVWGSSSAPWWVWTVRPRSQRFGTYLDGTTVTVDQVRFVTLIVDELPANGLMAPARLYESPFTDHTPTGPETVFSEADVDGIVTILRTIKANAAPSDVVA